MPPQKPTSKPTEQEAGLAPDPVCSGVHMTSAWLSGEFFRVQGGQMQTLLSDENNGLTGSIISHATALNDAQAKLPKND